MGGGRTKTFQDVQLVGLLDEYGALGDKVILEAGKQLTNGSKYMSKSFGRSIVEIKSIYNDGFLNTLGYDPAENLAIKKVNVEALLQYTKDNVNNTTTSITEYDITYASLDIQSMAYIQSLYGDFDYRDKSFTKDSSRYLFYSSVQNGPYVDASIIRDDRTVIDDYLTNLYGLGNYAINSESSLMMHSGTISYEVNVTADVTTVTTTTTTVSGASGGTAGAVITESENYKKTVVTTNNTYVVSEEVGTDPVTGDPIYEDATYTDITVTTTIEEVITTMHYIPATIEYIQFANDTSDFQVFAESFSGLFMQDITVHEWASSSDGEGSFMQDVGYIFEILSTVTYLGGAKYSVSSYATDRNDLDTDAALYYDISYRLSIAENKRESTIRMAIERFLNTLAQKIVWFYKYGDGKIAPHFVTLESVPELITLVQSATYPIIPLKQDSQLVNSDNLDILLNKIGMEAKDFKESLEDDELRAGYLLFGVPERLDSEAAIAYAYEYLAMLADIEYTIFGKTGIGDYGSVGTGYGTAVRIEYEGFALEQSYTLEIEGVEDNTREVGTYWKETETYMVVIPEVVLDGGDTYETRTNVIYCKQETEGYYIKIKRTNMTSHLIAGGYIKTQMGVVGLTGARADTGDAIYPLLREVTNKIPFNLFCDIFEMSMHIAAYSYIQVRVKWYQTMFFRFVFSAIAMYSGNGWAIFIMIGLQAAVEFGLISPNTGLVITIILAAFGVYNADFSSALGTVAFVGNIVSIVTSVSNWMYGRDYAKSAQQIEDAEAQNEKEQEEYEEEMSKYNDPLLLASAKNPEPSSFYYTSLELLTDPYNLLYEQPYNYDMRFDVT